MFRGRRYAFFCKVARWNYLAEISASLLQAAATCRKSPQASCKLQQPVGNLRKLPASCSNLSEISASFLQAAATCRKSPQASCKLQQLVGNFRRLPASCSNSSEISAGFLQAAASQRESPMVLFSQFQRHRCAFHIAPKRRIPFRNLYLGLQDAGETAA